MISFRNDFRNMTSMVSAESAPHPFATYTPGIFEISDTKSDVEERTNFIDCNSWKNFCKFSQNLDSFLLKID